MNSPRSKSTGQLLFGSVLILLVTLGLILLYKDLSRRPPGKSRIDWPAAQPAKP
jgi:hypothetical protein